MYILCKNCSIKRTEFNNLFLMSFLIDKYINIMCCVSKLFYAEVKQIIVYLYFTSYTTVINFVNLCDDCVINSLNCCLKM